MHITIAGKLGSGKSTVCTILKAKYGFSTYSTGTIQRGLAEKMGLTTLEMNKLMSTDVKYDHLIDDEVTRISKEKCNETIIFDSRMAWNFAVNSFKVYLVIDPLIAAERVYTTRKSSVENYSSVEEANSLLTERAMVENERFKNIYKVDNFDYNNYDLIVDTSYATPEEVSEAIYNGFMEFCSEKYNETRLALSPKCMYPTKTVDEGDVAVTGNIPANSFADVALKDGYIYILKGHSIALEALLNDKTYVNAKLCDNDGVSDAISIDTLSTFENFGKFKYKTIPNIYR